MFPRALTAFSFALLVCLIGAVASSAQDAGAVMLKLRHAEKGDVIKVQKSEVNNISQTVQVDGKVVKNEKLSALEVNDYQETVIERTAGARPTKLERAYSKASRSIDKAKEVDFAYAGKTVLIERTVAGYRFRLKGGTELEKEDAGPLLKEFSKPQEERPLDKLFFPKEAVKAGDSWKVDLKPIATDISSGGGFDFDLAKSSGTGKLIKVYTKDSIQFGVIEVDIQFVMTGIGKNITFKDGSSFTIKIQMDICVDGTREAGKVLMSVKMKGDGVGPNNVGIQMNVEGTVTESRNQVVAVPK